MGASPAVEGLLVPFVLRDRMAAALYVDRFEDDPPLGRQSLQLLSYVGAQAVEGLAMRERAETPTLHVATEATAPGVELWEGPTAAEPAPEVAPTPIEEVPVEEVAVEEAPVEVMEAEPVEAEPIEAEPEEAAEAAPADLTLEELPEEAPAAELVTQALPVMEPEVPIAEAETPIVVEQEPTAEELVEEPTPLLELPAEEEAVEPVEERAPWAETADDGLATVEVEPTPQPEEIIPAAGSPLGETGGETTEVRPPTDVAGPGWAFTANRAGAETGDEAQHEEARRLARLLVTEIKLYNEEQVEEGRRGNDIYARLKEDIDRSRQIFNERVDEDVRQETDYFHEEMVRIGPWRSCTRCGRAAAAPLAAHRAVCWA
jgi:hypothetical protein